MRAATERAARRLALAAALLVATRAAGAAPRDLVPAAQAAPEPLAVVVHPGLGLRELTLRELRAIFRGDQQFWPGGRRRVTLLLPPPGTLERRVVLRLVFGMNEAEYTRFWIGKTFRDEVLSGPKIVDPGEVTLRLVRALPGAIAFVRARDVDGRVQVLRIDGRRPGEADYPLHDAAEHR